MNNMDKINNDGMIHGRFQPFTIGHMQHLKRGISRVKKGNKLYIGITKPFSTDNGISEGDDHRDSKSSNPYTFEQRRAMILKSIEMDSSISERIDDVIVIPWTMNNMEDLDKIINCFMPNKDVTQFMNIIPGDGWEYEKKKILEKKGFKTMNLVDIARPRITSATEVRNRYNKKEPGDWRDVAPKGTQYILTELEKDSNIIPQQYTSIDEYLSKCAQLTTLDIAKNVLPRTPQEQETVDEVGKNIQKLLEPEKESRDDK